MGSIELLVIFAMAPFDLTVMPGRAGLDELVPDAKLLAGFLKESQLGSRMTVETVGELKPVVGLDALNGNRELFHTVEKEDSGRISTATAIHTNYRRM